MLLGVRRRVEGHLLRVGRVSAWRGGLHGQGGRCARGGLVDAASVRRLLASAPLLTAVCAFREFPRLRHCVVRRETDGLGASALSVLSRGRLEAALLAGRFPAAFPDPVATAKPFA